MNLACIPVYIFIHLFTGIKEVFGDAKENTYSAGR